MLRQILVRSEHCVACKSCELACAVAHSASKDLFQALFETQKPQKRVFVETNGSVNFPLQCRQCSDTPCVHACMSGAMHLDPESGLVQADAERCVGCWMCVMVCPFGAISAEKSGRGAVKCDRCREMNYDPACVQACPTHALEFVEVSEFARSGRRNVLEQLKGV